MISEVTLLIFLFIFRFFCFDVNLLLRFAWSANPQRFTDRSLVQEADDLLKKLGLVGQAVSFKQMMSVIEECRQLSERQIPLNLQSNQLELNQPTAAGLQMSAADNKTSSLIWNGIVPGTLWCGLGDSAKHYDDLGPRQDIDICCRAQ